MSNQILSIYELIKQKSKEKGRSLKIVCDWDECLQPVNLPIWHRLAKEKGWTIPKNLDFNEWFQYFWENAQIKHEQNLPRTKNTTIKEIEEIRNDEKKFEEMVRKPYFAIMNDTRYYEKAPFLSISNDLLLALKDNLINDINCC